jgi:hypothetical protein
MVAVAPTVLTSLEGAKGISIENLVLDGAGTATYNVRCDRMRMSTWRGCVFTNSASYAVVMGSTSSAANDGSYSNNFYSCYFQGPGALLISSFTVASRAGNTGAYHCTFTGCEFDFTGAYGIDIENGDNNAFISARVFRRSGSGAGIRIGPYVDTNSAYNSYFYHLQCDGGLSVAAGNPNAGECFGYDRTNGQPAPSVGAGSVFYWSESGSGATLAPRGNGPAPWLASSNYFASMEVIGSDGNHYRSLAGTNIGHDPVSDSGSWWELSRVCANTVLNVPSRFSSIQAAVDFAKAAVIGASYLVTIQVADGSYTVGAQINLQMVSGARVNIVGNTATPANVVLNFSGTNGFMCTGGTFYVGLIDGTTIVGTLGGGFAGVTAAQRCQVVIGGSVVVKNFDVGFNCGNAGRISMISGGKAQNCGIGFICSNSNSTMIAISCTALNCTTAGYYAQDDAHMSVTSCAASNVGTYGIDHCC